MRCFCSAPCASQLEDAVEATKRADRELKRLQASNHSSHLDVDAKALVCFVPVPVSYPFPFPLPSAHLAWLALAAGPTGQRPLSFRF
jgi:hypothetical protein